ncbi:hypothetical protein OFM13_28250, partial [Escherichia coli]|nr:hypothetical protein [Escherichia coli]
EWPDKIAKQEVVTGGFDAGNTDVRFDPDYFHCTDFLDVKTKFTLGSPTGFDLSSWPDNGKHITRFYSV